MSLSPLSERGRSCASETDRRIHVRDRDWAAEQASDMPVLEPVLTYRIVLP